MILVNYIFPYNQWISSSCVFLPINSKIQVILLVDSHNSSHMDRLLHSVNISNPNLTPFLSSNNGIESNLSELILSISGIKYNFWILQLSANTSIQ